MENYWDRIADQQKDNIWKRAAIVSRLLNLDLIGESVLEIGVGMGTAAAALNVVFFGQWDYKGTDVSEKNCQMVRDTCRLDVQQADIVSLPFPDKSFDTIIALDVLEHVEDKASGFKEINRVLREWGRVVLNIPLSDSAHDDEQEFGFDKNDLFALLQACNMELKEYEVFTKKPGKGCPLHYAWAVGVR